MLRFTLVVIIETLGLVALAPKKAHAQFQNGLDTLVVDPADRSVYVARAKQVFGSADLNGRWLADGSFDRMNGPFALAHAQRELTPMLVAGRMTLVADGQTLYQKDAEGAWRGTPARHLAGDPLDCGSDPKGPCQLLTTLRDGNGDQDLLVINPTGVQIRYPTEGGYRGAVGIEAKLDLNTVIVGAFGHREYVWAPDHQHMLHSNLPSGRGEPAEMSYKVVTTDGEETRAITYSEPLGAASQRDVVQVGDSVYMVVSDYSGGGGSPDISVSFKVQIFAIEEPFSKTPQAKLLLHDDNFTIATAVGVLHEGEYLYLMHGRGIDAHLTAYHPKTKDLVDLGSCPLTAPLVKLDTQKGDSNLWIACGQNIMALHDGHILQRYTAAAPITSGTALAALPGKDADVLVTEKGGGMERFTPDGQHQRIGPDGAHSILRPALKASWLTATGQLCGVTEETPTEIGCERGRVWSRGMAPMPAPFRVWHTPDAEWAMSLVGQETSVYRRPLAAAESAWQKVQGFTAAPGSRMAMRFIAQGNAQVAVQDGDGQFWRWDGQSFTQSYPHPFVVSELQPVISEDGTLYDVCDHDSPSRVCAYSPAGTKYVLEGSQSVSTLDTLVPLKRGVLAMARRDAVVIRGNRTIELSKLHGAFTRGKEQYGSVTGPALGDGTVLLRTPKADKIYRYDGHDANLFKTVADNDDVDLAEPAKGQIWLGMDGIWRLASAGDGRGFIYAKDPLQLTSVNRSVRSGSQILAAAVFGSQIWLATPHGLWSCANAAGTPLNSETAELPVTQGCSQRWGLPYVTAMKATDHSLVMMQGQRVLELTPGLDPSGLDDRLDVLSTTIDLAPSAGALGHVVIGGRDLVSFVEADHLVIHGGQPDLAQTIALPTNVTAQQVKATTDRWLCSESGLFWLDDSRSWQAASGDEACVGMAAMGAQVLALTRTEARFCQQGACAEATPLPRSYLTDTIVGTLAPAGAAEADFGLVMGQRLYRFTSAGFVDITPTYAKGSALLMTASNLNDGLISLQTGGVVARQAGPTASPAWRHLRLQ